MELGVKLSKKGWHYRLQGYVLKSQRPELHSLCPYFWLTILCILMLPFVMPIRFAERVMDFHRKYIQEPKVKRMAERMSNEDLLKLWKNKLNVPRVGGLTKDEVRAKLRAIYLKRKGIKYYDPEYREDDPDYIGDGYWDLKYLNEEDTSRAKSYFELLKELRELEASINKELEEKEDAAYRKRQERKRRMEERIDKVMSPIENAFQKLTLMKATLYLQRFFTLAITVAIAFGLGAGLMFVGKWLVSLDWASIISTAEMVLLILAFIGAIIALVYLIRDWRENWLESRQGKPKSQFWQKVGAALLPIALPIGAFFKIIAKLIWAPFRLFWLYFKATKNNYCPAIEWDDE